MLDCADRAALVQVDDKGHLTSGSLTGTASLQISSQETFGVNQTIIVAVKVKISNNAYILIIIILQFNLQLRLKN